MLSAAVGRIRVDLDILISQFLSVLVPFLSSVKVYFSPSFRDPNFGLFCRKPDPLALRFFPQCFDVGSVVTLSCDDYHRTYPSTRFFSGNPFQRPGGTSIAQNTPHPLS